jgi:hypothetical protein
MNLVWTDLVAGEKNGKAEFDCLPEGLKKNTDTLRTPDKSSVADTLTVTTACRDLVSMVVGVKLNAVRVGGVMSWLSAEVCERDTPKKVTTTTSPTFDERSARHKDLSCAQA